MDNRDLDPPEPMEKILAATQAMAPGEVLCALLRREPLFLFPELAKRGHKWRGDFEADHKAYKILIRVGDKAQAAA
jgi:TusA-related sulfurtransferase